MNDDRTNRTSRVAGYVVLIVALGLLIYSNTFQVPFFFDDKPNIIDNPVIRELSYYLSPSAAKEFVIYDAFKSRFTGYLSFALNYRLHGLDVTGYHVANLMIHLANALIVYLLVTLTFRTPFFSIGDDERSLGTGRLIALYSALIFVAHPVQTQAVTYVVQRFASLATMFFLLSLASYVRSRLSASNAGRIVFYSLSLVSAVIAMKTKEIAITLPLIIALYEVMFFKGGVWRRFLYLLPVLLTLLIIPLTLLGTDKGFGALISEADKSTKLLTDMSRPDYLLTEFRVIVTYIRLLILPIRQNVDYDYPLYHSFWNPAVLLSFLCILSLLGLAVYLWHRSKRDDTEQARTARLISFGIFWFFITLSVESSVIPIIDVIFEHRLYLPSVGALIAITATACSTTGKWASKQSIIIILAIIVICFSVATYLRNRIWQDEVVFWSDAVSKSPNKARVHNNLGAVYILKGDFVKTIQQSQIALQLDRNFYEAHNNMGIAYASQGYLDKAIEQFQFSLRLNPDYAEAYNNLGLAFASKSMFGPAMAQFEIALRLKPGFIDAHNNLGAVYASTGRIEDAMKQFQAVLRLDPDDSRARSNLEIAKKELLK